MEEDSNSEVHLSKDITFVMRRLRSAYAKNPTGTLIDAVEGAIEDFDARLALFGMGEDAQVGRVKVMAQALEKLGIDIFYSEKYGIRVLDSRNLGDYLATIAQGENT